jgi:hypothetical protein
MTFDKGQYKDEEKEDRAAIAHASAFLIDAS